MKIKVRATKLIYTSNLKRIRKGEVFRIDPKDFSKHSMEKVEDEMESEEPDFAPSKKSKKAKSFKKDEPIVESSAAAPSIADSQVI